MTSCFVRKCRATSSITPRQAKAGASSTTTAGTDHGPVATRPRRYTSGGQQLQQGLHTVEDPGGRAADDVDAVRRHREAERLRAVALRRRRASGQGRVVGDAQRDRAGPRCRVVEGVPHRQPGRSPQGLLQVQSDGLTRRVGGDPGRRGDLEGPDTGSGVARSWDEHVGATIPQ
ncbi:hypothetical protein WDV91_02855 [Curtobacterium flaccumfaciens pv. flaccumfaciens]